MKGFVNRLCAHFSAPWGSWGRILGLALLSLSLVGCTFSFSSASASGIAPEDLEAQVLEIIRNNPEVVLESLQQYQIEQQQRQQQEQEDATQAVINELRQDPEAFIGTSPTKGSESNEIVLVEFSDFQCPFCARAKRTVEQFMDAYGQEVKLVFKHLPLTQIHPQALPAAKAAWAADRQGQFWAFHDKLFENQSRLGEDLFLEAAQELDLDINRFNRDRNGRAAEQAVNADIEIARQLGIQGTPYFLMNEVPINGAQPLSAFEQALEQVRG
jgi:protein-disulfide isomerase